MFLDGTFGEGKEKGKLTAGHSREQTYLLFHFRFFLFLTHSSNRGAIQLVGTAPEILLFFLSWVWDGQGVTTVYDHTPFWGKRKGEVVEKLPTYRAFISCVFG